MKRKVKYSTKLFYQADKAKDESEKTHFLDLLLDFSQNETSRLINQELNFIEDIEKNKNSILENISTKNQFENFFTPQEVIDQKLNLIKTKSSLPLTESNMTSNLLQPTHSQKLTEGVPVLKQIAIVKELSKNEMRKSEKELLLSALILQPKTVVKAFVNEVKEKFFLCIIFKNFIYLEKKGKQCFERKF